MTVLSGACGAPAGWRDDANARIEKTRKSDYRLTVTDPQGEPLAGVTVQAEQTDSDFGFGTCVTGDPTTDNPVEKRYWQFIADHFNMIVDENTMKWYATQKKPGPPNWEPGDKKVAWALGNGLRVRGHCLFWSKRKFVKIQPWLLDLSKGQLRKAVDRRIEGAVSRYKGKLVAWDVNNEMLDGHWYADRLGKEIRVHMFKAAHKIDPDTPLYVNEYGVLDNNEKTRRYIELIKRLQEAGAPIGGIGIQEHASERFSPTAEQAREDKDRPERAGRDPLTPAKMLATLDELGKFDLPIHLTEVSSKTADETRRADTLEMLFRVGYSHPKVEAILLWGFWGGRHWLGSDATIVNKDFTLKPAGKRLFEMIHKEWRTGHTGKTDARGQLSFRGFHGTYTLRATGPEGKPLTATVRLNAKTDEATVKLQPATGEATATGPDEDPKGTDNAK